MENIDKIIQRTAQEAEQLHNKRQLLRQQLQEIEHRLIEIQGALKALEEVKSH